MAESDKNRKLKGATIISEQLLLNNFIENIPDNIYFKDINSKFIKVNEATANKLGFANPEDLIGKSDFDIFDEVNAAGAFKDEQEIIRTGKPYISEEKKEVWKDGKVTWAVSHKMPNYDADGNIIGIFGYTTDITKRKKAELVREALLSISEAAYTASDMKTFYQKIHDVIITLMPAKNICIAIYDEKTDLISFPYYVNEFESIPIQRKLNKGLVDFIFRYGSTILADENKLNLLIKLGEIEESRTLPRILLGAPLKIDGKIIGVIIIQDYNYEKAYGEDEKNLLVFVTEQITHVIERKRNSEAVQKYADELKQLNNTKDKFFSIIAHDLKSPFQGFVGLTEILANDIDSFSQEEVSTLMNDLNKTAGNLYKLLINLLEWARMQQGSIVYNPKEIVLEEIVSQNITLLTKNREQKDIKIVLEVPVDQKVYADEAMLNSILRNLLSNAVKFTKKGGQVKVKSEKSGNNMVEISISDNGIGIPKSIIEKLFKMEEKVGQKGTEGEESTGLGLLLCKEFVDKHGGSIWVESVENIGSTFYFTLPIHNTN